MAQLPLNLYAPDVEGTFFGGQGNAPEDIERLRLQLESFRAGVKVISATPSFHGTIDVVIEADRPTLLDIAAEFGEDNPVINI